MANHYNETVVWATMQTRNRENLHAWQRKMRCIRAVESVGESGERRDLRTDIQQAQWANIVAKRVMALVWIGRPRVVGDPDSSDGAH